jgi:hypothetical protein
LPPKAHYAMKSVPMPKPVKRDFGGRDDAKAKIHTAVEYLLRGTSGRSRADIALEIIEIVRDVANGPSRGKLRPLGRTAA